MGQVSNLPVSWNTGAGWKPAPRLISPVSLRRFNGCARLHPPLSTPYAPSLLFDSALRARRNRPPRRSRPNPKLSKSSPTSPTFHSRAPCAFRQAKSASEKARTHFPRICLSHHSLAPTCPCKSGKVARGIFAQTSCPAPTSSAPFVGARGLQWQDETACLETRHSRAGLPAARAWPLHFVCAI